MGILVRQERIEELKKDTSKRIRVKFPFGFLVSSKLPERMAYNYIGRMRQIYPKQEITFF